MIPTAIRLRSVWFQLHKWIGITLAILIIPISLTGAVLVWHDWLDGQVHPQRYPSAGAAALPPSAFAASASRLLEPGERVHSIRFPEEKGSVQATLIRPAEDGARPKRARVFLDPKTAQPIERAANSEGLLGLLHDFHGNLMVPGIGRKIVGCIGIAMLLSSLTGLWLWWPLNGRIRRGLRWKRRPDFNSNLHHTGGFWIALPLAVLSLTGAWISFPSVFGLFGGLPPVVAGSGPAMPLTQFGLTPEQALAEAQKLVAGQPAGLVWPTEDSAEWTVMIRGSGRPAEIKVADSGASAQLVPARPETLMRTMRRIHDGTGMPLAWRIIIFAGGILPALLAVTGILMWLRMRRRRERHRTSMAALSEGEALVN